MKRYLVFLSCIICFSECGFETNTTDTQISETIEESKKNNFFVCELNSVNSNDGFFKFKKAWIEHDWKYKKNLLKKDPIQRDGYQLVFQISEYLKPGINFKSHLLDWSMKGSNGDYIGTSSSQYFMYLKKNELAQINILLRLLGIRTRQY